MNEGIYKPVEILPRETALKIAAGEVIERPASVVRELLDNSIDAKAKNISLELEDGGIERIRVVDDGCGMTRSDLNVCTLPHSTSKIYTADDLLHLTSLGFRGEALSSIQAVSDLEIISKRDDDVAWKLKNNRVEPTTFARGTSVEVSKLFENFPARKKFLKRPQYESTNCRQIFIEKSLPFYEISMNYRSGKSSSLQFYKCESLRQRCLQVFSQAFGFIENEELFFEITRKSENFSFNAVLGTPDVYRSNKKYIYVFVNGRRINEFGFVQSVCYGSEGYFPNGNFPVVFLFLQVEPSRVDFNIHPAKKEAHFEDYHEIHHAIHTAITDFYKQKTILSILQKDEDELNHSLPLESSSLFERRDNANNDYSRTAFNQNSLAQTLQATASFQNPMLPSSTKSYFNSSDISQIFPIKRTEAPIQTAESAPEYSHEGQGLYYNFKVLGQFCGTFIAVEKDNALYIIDQHAAHERIIYEAIKKTVGSSQELLAPYMLQTSSNKNDEIIRNNQEALNRAGFRIEEKGDGLWEISAVPPFYKGSQKQLLHDIQEAKSAESVIDHLLATASCRAACKDGDILDYAAMCDIVAKTFLLPEPLCPHGRPIYFILGKLELFKKVKRIT